MELQEYHNLRHIEDTHFWFRSLHELVLRTLRKACKGSNLTILDAGCGTGGLMKKLKTLGTVEGVDSSPLAIQLCQEGGLAHTRIADLNTVQLPRDHYDAIVSLDVLYHQGITDVPSLLHKFSDALKPGGILFLHLPAFEAFRSYHDTHVHTARRFRLHETKQLLRDAGFSVERGSYRVTLLLPLILLRRFLARTRHHSDLGKLPACINIPLLFLSRLENTLTQLLPLPCGLSLYILARKPATPTRLRRGPRA